MNIKKFVLAGLLVVFSFCAIACGKDDTGDKADKNSLASTAPSSTNTNIKYDALQQLYLDLDKNMSYKDMLKLVKSTKLPYSEETYNGSKSVQVAFTEGCTYQSYKKESGDYLEITYEYLRKKDKYTFGTCVYVPSDSTLELINHVTGSYFSYYKRGNYICDLGNDLNLDKNMSKEEQLKYYFEHK